MNIAHIIPYIGERQGGPVLAVRDVTAALAGRAVVTVYSTPLPGDGPEAVFDPSVTICRFAASALGGLRISPALRSALAHGDAGVFHSHGLWTFAAFAAFSAARRKGVAHVVAPCGMLQSGALNRSRWKKRLVGWLFQWRALRSAACLHAKSDAEAESFRAAGLRRPVAVIPNPVVAPPEFAVLGSPLSDSRARPDSRTLLYLGRLHPVKGLRRLVLAWNRLAVCFPDWRLVLAGPDENGYGAELRGLLAPEAAGRAHFAGAMNTEEKWSALRDASLFVMPSDFENFGSAIAEALCAGTPVLTTTTTPWQSLVAARAGWVVDPTEAALTEALEEALNRPREQLAEMGQRARGLAEAFAPDQVADRLMALYEWLTGRGPRPEIVLG